MNCCDYECNQGRNCPVRARLVSKQGGARIDTEDDFLKQDNAFDAAIRWGLLPLSIFLLAVAAALALYFR